MFQMTAPRVKVIRLEMMLTSIDDCGVIAADVGAAALASVKEVWRRAMMARCGCFDVVDVVVSCCLICCFCVCFYCLYCFVCLCVF